jgi:flagellar biosynthesis protein FlhA
VPLLKDAGAGKPTLLARLTAVRQQYSRRMGFVVPNIHVRDTEGVRPQEYRFTIRGAVVGRGEVASNAMLAIETPDVGEKLAKGRRVRDPIYGHDAVWISPDRVQEAEALGYTVADPGGVVATHLGFVLERFGWELVGRAEVDELVGQLAKSHAKLVDDLRNRVQPGVIRHVLQGLLAEGVPVKDLERIAEAISDAPDPLVKDHEKLLASVRLRLGRQIVSGFLGNDQVLRVLVLDPQLEGLVHKAVSTARDQGFEQIIEPNTAKLLRAAATRGKEAAEQRKTKPVLAVQSAIRRPVARCLSELLPVIAAEEIPEFMSVLVIDAVRPLPSGQPQGAEAEGVAAAA